MFDNYYCTSCGASLYKQIGFHSRRKTWTCKKCGTQLYGWGVYDGEKYPGVMWYCDGCNDLLNTQEGFTDTQETYTCKKCGYVNPINTDNIDNYTSSSSDYDNEDTNSSFDDYNDSDNFYNNNEDDSNSYDNSDDSFSNEEYETNSYADESYDDIEQDLLFPDVTWYCDECNSVLNEQVGFTDREGTWECTECGHINDINEDEIDNDVDDDSYYSSYYSNDDSSEDSSYNYSYSPSTEDIKPKEKGKIAKFFDSVLKTIRIIFIITAVIFLTFMGWKIYNKYYNPETHPGQIKLQSSQSSYKDQDYMVVYREFKNAGFKNVKLEPIKDIVLGWFAKEGEVEEVTIDDGGFKSGEWISENAKIIIKYHVKKD